MEEWMEEVKAHCERCHDDNDETSHAGGQDPTTTTQRGWSRSLDWKED